MLVGHFLLSQTGAIDDRLIDLCTTRGQQPGWIHHSSRATTTAAPQQSGKRAPQAGSGGPRLSSMFWRSLVVLDVHSPSEQVGGVALLVHVDDPQPVSWVKDDSSDPPCPFIHLSWFSQLTCELRQVLDCGGLSSSGFSNEQDRLSSADTHGQLLQQDRRGTSGGEGVAAPAQRFRRQQDATTGTS